MAERTKEHEKLIEEAKDLGIKSPHLFGEDTLAEKIAEVKGGKDSRPDDTSDQLNTEEVTTNESADDSQSDDEDSDVVVMDGDGWLYHETEQPRIFKDGEEVPEGWNMDNRVHWKVLNDSGKFVNVNS